MTVRPDIKFYSLDALRRNYTKLQKTNEHIIISADCFWACSNRILHGLNYEMFTPSVEWLSKQDFTPTFKYLYKELIAAIECNETKYVDEVIFVGAPWELEEANKYFGDGMIIDGYNN